MPSLRFSINRITHFLTIKINLRAVTINYNPFYREYTINLFEYNKSSPTTIKVDGLLLEKQNLNNLNDLLFFIEQTNPELFI